MTPDWERLSIEVEIVAALVAGLAKRSSCPPQTVLDAIAEHLDAERPAGRLRVVSEDPQAAA